MPGDTLAIVISIFSAIIAFSSLGWNIYRDVILKSKVSISFSIVFILHESLPEKPEFINIKATNFGPGPIYLSSIILKKSSIWRIVFRKIKFAIVNQDYTNPMSSSLPKKLEVGDKIELLLPYDSECFLSKDFTQVGINDYFGRIHWCSAKDFKKATKKWKTDFKCL